MCCIRAPAASQGGRQLPLQAEHACSRCKALNTQHTTSARPAHHHSATTASTTVLPTPGSKQPWAAARCTCAGRNSVVGGGPPSPGSRPAAKHISRPASNYPHCWHPCCYSCLLTSSQCQHSQAAHHHRCHTDCCRGAAALGGWRGHSAGRLRDDGSGRGRHAGGGGAGAGAGLSVNTIAARGGVRTQAAGVHAASGGVRAHAQLAKRTAGC